MLLALLVLVPLTALGLVLGLARLEEALLTAPAAPAPDDVAGAEARTPAPARVPAGTAA